MATLSLRPTPDEYAQPYARYIDRVPESDAAPVLRAQIEEIRRLAAAVPPEKETFRYAPDKWMVREVLGHVNDAERVFGYRFLRIRRADPTPMESFDENQFAATSDAADRPLAKLADEFVAVRSALLPLLEGLTPADWRRTGTASGWTVSLAAVAWMAAGHVRHHQAILRERYGLG